MLNVSIADVIMQSVILISVNMLNVEEP
jgi:hypothetical protein